MRWKWFIPFVWFTVIGVISTWSGGETPTSLTRWLIGFLYWSLATAYLYLTFRRTHAQ